MVDLVERCELGQLALLHREAHLPPTDFQLVGVHPGGGRELLPDRLRAGIDVVVEHDVDLARLARRRPWDGGRENRRRGIRRRGSQRWGDLEPLQVDVGPHDERQRPNYVQVAWAVPAQVGVLGDVLLDLDAELRELLLLLVGQGTAGLDEHIVGLRGVRRLQPRRPERIGLGDRVQRDAIDGDERHAPDSNPVGDVVVSPGVVERVHAGEQGQEAGGGHELARAAGEPAPRDGGRCEGPRGTGRATSPTRPQKVAGVGGVNVGDGGLHGLHGGARVGAFDLPPTRIRRAAEALFLRDGYARTSMTRIAEEAAVAEDNRLSGIPHQGSPALGNHPGRDPRRRF